MYEYRAKILRVVDGDTVEAEVDLGFRVSLRMMLRLYGINAPERRGPTAAAGETSKQKLIDLLELYDREHGHLTIWTQRDRQEKYGRWLATLRYGTVDVNAAMIASGHASPAYYGE